MVGATLTYATALYFSYVAVFVYFFSTPFHPGGDSYGGRTCFEPHLFTGQMCRDWSEHGFSGAWQVGSGAGFLVGFLLLALVARRWAWIFLLVPVATLPCFSAEHRVWLMSVVVSVIAVAGIAGLRLLAQAGPVPQLRWLPVGLLSAGASGAMVLSILTSGPSVASISAVSGLATWPATEVQGIACPSPTSCVAVGEHDSPSTSIAIALEMRGSTWGHPTPIPRVYGLDNVTCADVGDCIAIGVQTDALVVEHDGRWAEYPRSRLWQSHDGSPTFLSDTACSASGLCWATYHAFEGSGSSLRLSSYAVGVAQGRWLPVHRLGPRVTAHGWEVVASGVSCWSTTSCTFTGIAYPARSESLSSWQQFVQTETNGVWSPGLWIPSSTNGSAKSRFESYALESSPISCSARGTCLLGGFEMGRNSSIIGAAAEQEVDGRWLPTAIGTGGALGGEDSGVVKVACHTTALCVAVGGGNSHGNGWLFFRADVRGRWQRALLAPIGGGGFAIIGSSRPTAASCPTASTCYVVGWFTTTHQRQLAFAASYVSGQWSFEPLDLGRGEDVTLLDGLACDSTACWAVGTAQWSNQQSEGFAYPIAHFTN